MPAPRFPSRRRTLREATILSAMLVVLALAPAGPVRSQPHYVIKIGTTAANGSPMVRQLQRLAAIIEERTAGLAVAKLFPNARLGDDVQLTAAARAGSLQIYAGGFASLAAVAHELRVLSLPYLFADYHAADSALDGQAREQFAEALSAHGLLLAAWGPSVYQRWFSRGPAPTTPREVAGLKIVDPSKTIATEHWQALGALHALAPPDDTAAASRWLLRTTTVVARATGAAAETTHITRADDVLDGYGIVISERWYNGLPGYVREALTRLPEPPTVEARKEARVLDEALLQRIAARGKLVATPSAEAREAFRQAATQFAKQIAQGADRRTRGLLRALSAPGAPAQPQD